ncbi:MAG: GNAT family N-acetyltransferase [Bacteroides uniformis]|nr:GNAT family N-acetyltransferase [Bacteroides uniformis]
MIRIHPISGNKKQYLDLLLADEQESMIDRYLERGEMFILSDNDTVKASCVITCEDKGIYEIKSIAVYPEYQRQGYGRQLIAFVLEHYKDRCHTMLVGTGDSPLTIPFYESCGFAYSHRVPDFFIDNYDHPIFEGGKQLKDMIYLKRTLQPK